MTTTLRAAFAFAVVRAGAGILVTLEIFRGAGRSLLGVVKALQFAAMEMLSDDAFEAAEFLVDWLKTKAPFWKLEESGAGGHWVEAKAIDDKAADRWTLAAPGPAQHRKAG